jgi:uncharacterized protein YbjT (DUF2867 family)
MSKTALVAGYTGLVGSHLLQRLLAEEQYARIVTVGRRAPTLTSQRLESRVLELGDLSRACSALAADDVFCCLGTTIKAAGSRAAFERVDYHMVVDLARAARAAGARRFFLVSSLSANPRSPVYYSRVKGRTEMALREVGFETLHILRPSLLLGDRSESRPGEALAQRLAPLINPLLRGVLTPYRAVAGDDVAAALIQLAARDQPGVTVSTLPLA